MKKNLNLLGTQFFKLEMVMLLVLVVVLAGCKKEDEPKPALIADQPEVFSPEMQKDVELFKPEGKPGKKREKNVDVAQVTANANAIADRVLFPVVNTKLNFIRSVLATNNIKTLNDLEGRGKATVWKKITTFNVAKNLSTEQETSIKEYYKEIAPATPWINPISQINKSVDDFNKSMETLMTISSSSDRIINAILEGRSNQDIYTSFVKNEYGAISSNAYELYAIYYGK
jgi:uncharacterized lipoprotein